MYKSNNSLFFQLLSFDTVKLCIHIRHSEVSFINGGFLTFLYQRILAIFLFFCKAEIVFCAKSAFDAHAPLFNPYGLNRHVFSIRPNPIDLRLFIFSHSTRYSLRESLGIPNDSFVVQLF